MSCFGHNGNSYNNNVMFWLQLVVLTVTMSRYETFGSINKQYRLNNIPDCQTLLRTNFVSRNL